MRDAQIIADFLKSRHVKATFFLANEKTTRGDFALDDTWASFWSTLAQEEHLFGSHTWRHGKILPGDSNHIQYKPQFGGGAGQSLSLSTKAFCQELEAVNTQFKRMTGKSLSPLWRAPGGRTTPLALSSASICGYQHVGWDEAGFLGDELNSTQYPNSALSARALKNIRSGDILMAHLGIWSRQEKFFPALKNIVVGLQDQGFCFKTIDQHPNYQPLFKASSTKASS